MNAFLLVSLFARPTLADELWLELRSSGPTELRLEVPAAWLLSAEEPVELELDGETVDLRALARVVDGGRRGGHEVAEGVDEQGQALRVEISKRRGDPSDPARVEALELSAGGASGGALQLALPLVGGAGGLGFELAASGFEAQVRIAALTLPWRAEEFLGAITRAAPRTLAEVRAEGGSWLTVRSR